MSEKEYWFKIEGKIYAGDEDDAYEQLSNIINTTNCERVFYEVEEDKNVS